MSEFLSVGLDVLVLTFLGVTIYYALHLSKSLNNFRAHRDEFGKVVRELTMNIEAAQEAVQSLKETGNRSGDDLQEVVDEAVILRDELKMINDVSNALASRLEGLAQKSRNSTGGPDYSVQEEEFISESDESLEEYTDPQEKYPFFIRDPDYAGDDDHEQDGDLHSEAERDLYKAIQSNKKKRMTGG
jgi:chromosome segregation ATPase